MGIPLSFPSLPEARKVDNSPGGSHSESSIASFLRLIILRTISALSLSPSSPLEDSPESRFSPTSFSLSRNQYPLTNMCEAQSDGLGIRCSLQQYRYGILLSWSNLCPRISNVQIGGILKLSTRQRFIKSPDPSHIRRSTAPNVIQFNLPFFLVTLDAKGEGKALVLVQGIGKLMINGTPNASARCQPQNEAGFAINISARNGDFRAANA
mmetsp:Transcript_16831/g.21512  ORF Transcript_16831/g.21512 Transcript_16831/m.21512 type:complete len:210 (-) Transcript_16831:23-652(-)